MEGLHGANGTFTECGAATTSSAQASPGSSPLIGGTSPAAGGRSSSAAGGGLGGVLRDVHGWAVNAAAAAPGGLLAKGGGGAGGRSRRRRSEAWGGARRRSSLSYGVMVIDMGVHQLSGLPQKVNLVQVGVGWQGGRHSWNATAWCMSKEPLIISSRQRCGGVTLLMVLAACSRFPLTR